MTITKQAAEQAFYNMANLLTLNDQVNLDSRALSLNVIEKLLNTIKGHLLPISNEWAYLLKTPETLSYSTIIPHPSECASKGFTNSSNTA